MNSSSSQCRKYSADVLGELFGYNKRLLMRSYPIPSMYGIFTYIYHKNQPNVGKSTIHGSYGYWNCTNYCSIPLIPFVRLWNQPAQKEGGKHLCLVGVNHGVLTDTVEDFTQINDIWPGQQVASCYTIKRRPYIWIIFHLITSRKRHNTFQSLCAIHQIFENCF